MPEPAPKSDRISYDDRGRLDDVAIFNVDCVRLEYMSEKQVWICLIREGKPDEVFWLHSKKRIKGRHEQD